MLIETLARTPEVQSLELGEALLARSLRLWVIARKRGACPLKTVSDRLGGSQAGAHFYLLLEEVGAAWPEPFCVAPPCCPRLTHDEALFLAMLASAADDDRPRFDRLLCELLPADVRDRLFFSASVLTRILGRVT